jgi:hypothetical protein
VVSQQANSSLVAGKRPLPLRRRPDHSLKQTARRHKGRQTGRCGTVPKRHAGLPLGSPSTSSEVLAELAKGRLLIGLCLDQTAHLEAAIVRLDERIDAVFVAHPSEVGVPFARPVTGSTPSPESGDGPRRPSSPRSASIWPASPPPRTSPRGPESHRQQHHRRQTRLGRDYPRRRLADRHPHPVRPGGRPCQLPWSMTKPPTSAQARPLRLDKRRTGRTSECSASPTAATPFPRAQLQPTGSAQLTAAPMIFPIINRSRVKSSE